MHFNRVLNVRSDFNVTELEEVRQRPLRFELGEKPTRAELAAAVMKLKNGKTGGSSGIRAEMVELEVSERSSWLSC